MKEATLFVDHTPTKLNAVALVPPPNGGKSKAKGALGGGRSNGGEASDLDGPHPNPPPWGERISELKVISKVFTCHSINQRRRKSDGRGNKKGNRMVQPLP